MPVAGANLAPLAASLPLPLISHDGHRCCRDRRTSRTLLGVAEDGYRLAVLPLTCRSWRCRCCAVGLRRRNRARAFRGATGRVAMVTLTLPAGRFSGSNATRLSIRHSSESWHRLRMILRREWGDVQYFKGLELTARGVAHLHVVVRVSSAHDFWRLRSKVRANAVRAGFGKVSQVDLARRSGDVARYVTKVDSTYDSSSGHVAAYATKGIGNRVPKWTRRASWSKDWASDWKASTPIAGFTWSVRDIDPDGLRDLITGSEFTLVDPASFRIASRPPGIPAGG